MVFFVQNNQYAISVPLAHQSVAPSLAHKAVGYGMAGERVDGNDIVALLAVLGRAVKLARDGSGPLLVEAHTYRMQAHTNADDATRYRAGQRSRRMGGQGPAEPDENLPDGPRTARRRRRRPDRRKAETVAAQLRDGLGEDVPVDPQDLFKYVFSTPDPAVEGTVRHARRRTGTRRRRPNFRGGRTMSPTITTSSEANGNVSAATARAAAKAAVEAEKTGPQTVTLAKALNTAMADAMHADDSVLVFGEDVGMLGGVFRITDGLTKTFGQSRCFDTPLAESGIVGMAVGMAMNGMRPVIEMQFDAFAYPAFEQIVSHVAKMHNRTKGTVKLPIVIRVPYAGGIGGVEHHCDSSEAYYAHTAGPEGFHPGHRGRRLPDAPRSHRLGRPGDVHGAQEAVLVQGPGGPGRAPRRARREHRTRDLLRGPRRRRPSRHRRHADRLRTRPSRRRSPPLPPPPRRAARWK